MATYSRSADQLARAVILVGLAAVIVGYAITKGSVMIALALVAIPLLACRRFTRYDGLAVGVMLTLSVPYWYTLGSSQSATFRVAAVFALATALFAGRARFTFVDGAIIAIVLIAVLGWLLQDDQPHVGKIVLSELLPFSFYFSARSLSAKHVPRVMALVAVVGMVGAVTVIGEFVAGHVLFPNTGGYDWEPSATLIFRPGGIFGSPPGAATVLAMAILCSVPIAPLRDTKWRAWRALRRTALAVMVLACVMTFTRAGLIGLAVGLLAYLWLMRSSLLTPARVLAAVVTLSVGVAVLLPQIEHTKTFQAGIVRPGDLTARENYWKLALPIMTTNSHNAIFGIGTERTAVPRVGGTMTSALASAPALIYHGTHNQYVLTALEEGLVGLLALIAWIAATIRTGLQTVRREHDALSAALVGATAAFAVMMSADNAFLHPPSLAMAALISGLLVARARPKSSQAHV